MFSVVIMGNGKQVLPVLHCLKRGIAFVSSFVFLFGISFDGLTPLWQINIVVVKVLAFTKIVTYVPRLPGIL